MLFDRAWMDLSCSPPDVFPRLADSWNSLMGCTCAKIHFSVPYLRACVECAIPYILNKIGYASYTKEEDIIIGW
jgi:hypothetical protein